MVVKTVKKSKPGKLAVRIDLKEDDKRFFKCESAGMPMLHDTCHKIMSVLPGSSIGTKENVDKMIECSIDNIREEIRANF